ncbi:MAG: hypothetical protein RL562_1492 [Planctomycetota bacterium]
MPDPFDLPRVDPASEPLDPAPPCIEEDVAAAPLPSEPDAAPAAGDPVEREAAGLGDEGRSGSEVETGTSLPAAARVPRAASDARASEDDPVRPLPAVLALPAEDAEEHAATGIPKTLAAPARAQQTRQSDDGREATRRVLLADNDPNVAAILELFLRKSGAEVVSVPHGEAALEALANTCFGLLVCDLDMPVMSGEELLDRIGSEPSTPPVFVISGYVDEVTSARLRSHRAVVDVLRKPFDLRAFATRAAALLDGRGQAEPDTGLGLFGEA